MIRCRGSRLVERAGDETTFQDELFSASLSGEDPDDFDIDKPDNTRQYNSFVKFNGLRSVIARAIVKADRKSADNKRCRWREHHDDEYLGE